MHKNFFLYNKRYYIYDRRFHMSFALQVKNTLMQDIADMEQIRWLFSKHPQTDFSRERKFNFSTTLHFLLGMETGTVRQELLKYFSFSPATPSNSAFFQQRNKLLPQTLPFLSERFNTHYPFSPYKNQYHLLACDGSSFTFTRNPLDTESYFPPDNKTTRGYNQVHLVALFDLLSKRYCDMVVQPIRKKNEFQALTTLIDRYHSSNTTPIFIADRGFHSFNVFAHAIEHNAYFLIRAKEINMQRLLGQELPIEEYFDLSVERILTRSQSKKKRLIPEREKDYRLIGKEVAFDYIMPGSQTEYPISLRILRFKISENTYESIITNLPVEEFSQEEIKFLYGLRWGIETSFRELKHTIGAIRFHSKQREYIEMELWARIILYNFCSIITNHVILKQHQRKHLYQVNYTIAYNACQYLFRLHQGETPPNIESLIEQNILPIRLDRKYARQHRFRVPVSFTYRFI